MQPNLPGVEGGRHLSGGQRGDSIPPRDKVDDILHWEGGKGWLALEIGLAGFGKEGSRLFERVMGFGRGTT